MNIPGQHKLIVQSVGKAAAKTFVQAFIGVLFLLVVPQLANWYTVVAGGGTVDIDIKWWANVIISAVGAGVAALISAAWNSLKGPTQETPVVVPPPVVVDN